MWFFLILAVSFVLALSVRMPAPKARPPAGLGDFNFPTAEEGREIPVVFGTRDVQGPNVVWYGHLKSVAIKKKVRTGLFSKKRVTVGYKYYVGMHMALCHGPVDYVDRIRVGEKVAWRGRAMDSQIYINNPGLFGGKEKEGGIQGYVDLMGGAPTQTTNSYLVARLGANQPAYRGVTGAVLRQVYVGTTPYIKPWSFRVTRVLKAQGGAQQWFPGYAPVNAELVNTTLNIVFALDISGSMAGERLTNMKGAVNIALDTIEYLVESGAANISIRIIGWSDEAPFVITRTDVDAAEIQELRDFVDGLEDQWGTDFNTAISAAAGFFPSTPASNIFFFVTDGVPTSGLEEAVSGAADYLSLDGGTYNIAAGTAVYMYGINIVLADTQYTAQLDNTDEDGVPVINGEDSTTLADIIRARIVGTNPDMNCVHVIRECLTNSEWGMGYQAADIDDDSFEAAAITCWEEGMGVSLIWDRQTPLNAFIDEIVAHANASLYVDRLTGKFKIKLIRDDYTVEALPVLDKSNVVRVESAARPTFGELVNSVSVNFHDMEAVKPASLTAQDVALIQQQGQVINTTVQYPGFTRRRIAGRVAQRDLQSLSSPLLGCTVYANREAATLSIGDPFVLDWPDLTINEYVMRVTGMAFGDARSNMVRIECVQDAFGLPDNATVTGDDPPDEEGDVAASPHSPFFEAPYEFMCDVYGQATVDADLAANPDIGVPTVAAVRPEGATGATFLVNLGSGFDDGESDLLAFSAYAELVDAVDQLETELSVNEDVDFDGFTAGDIALLGTEFVEIVSAATGTLTVKRGVLDTPPLSHAAGTKITALDNSETVPASFATGVTVSGKVLTSSATGELSTDYAPTLTFTVEARANRPYPPGDLQINDVAFPTEPVAPTNIVVSWVGRNRLTQTSVGDILAHSDAGVTAEAGTKYRVRVLTPGGGVDQTYDDVDALTQTVSAPSTGDYCTIQVWSKRNGMLSLYPATAKVYIQRQAANDLDFLMEDSATPAAYNALDFVL